MIYFQNKLLKKKQQIQMRYILKNILCCTALLGKQHTRFNTVPLVHFKPATVTRLDIILFNGQVMHLTYREKYMSCIQYSSYNYWRLFSFSSQVYDTNEKTSYWYYNPYEAIPAMMKLIFFNDLHWIDSGQQYLTT